MPTRIPQRLVIDTNVIISHMLIRDSVADQVVVRAIAHECLVQSEATFAELSEILTRPKFDRYLPLEHRRQLLNAIENAVEWVPIFRPVRACRDPHDNKFLDVAVNGEADAILTGDDDLLALNPFHGITILPPAIWLQRRPPPAG